MASGSKGVLSVHYKGKVHTISVDENVGKEVPVDDDGLVVKIVDYYANAVSKGGGEFGSSGDEPKNPMLRLDIKLQDRTAPVRCRCRVVAVDDGAASGGGGADLDIVECDEGSREGILESYVRWLHFRFFSEQ